MIIWLASYPRSGNTMLRSLLKQVFNLDSYSLYDDPHDIGASDQVASAVGHVMHHQSEEEFIQAAKRSDDVFFVKTHHPPRDDSKAIYIVRDGRAASVSYLHYMQHYGDQASETDLLDIVAGNVMFGSWSEHFETWSPEKRPGTLFLRYEDTCDWTPALVARIGGFIGREPKDQADNNFARMHALAPAFFRNADNDANIAQLSGAAADLFWMLHGETMLHLGYSCSYPSLLPGTARLAALALRSSTRRASVKVESANPDETRESRTATPPTYAEGLLRAREHVQHRQLSASQPDAERRDEIALALLRALSPYIPERIAIDVGAFDGAYIRCFRESGFRTIAFEPTPRRAERLRRRWRQDPLTTIERMALSDRDGLGEFYLGDWDASSQNDHSPGDLFNTLEPRAANNVVAYASKISVVQRRLASLVQTGLTPPDIGVMKIDAGGHNIAVLEGAWPFMARLMLCSYQSEGFALNAGTAKVDLTNYREFLSARAPMHALVVGHDADRHAIFYQVNPIATSWNSWGDILFTADEALFARAVAWCEDALGADLARS